MRVLSMALGLASAMVLLALAPFPGSAAECGDVRAENGVIVGGPGIDDEGRPCPQVTLITKAPLPRALFSQN